MSIAKTIEISSTSTKSFDDAVVQGLAKASKTVRHIEGAWVKEQKVDVENGEISRFRVDMKVTFLLNE